MSMTEKKETLLKACLKYCNGGTSAICSLIDFEKVAEVAGYKDTKNAKTMFCRLLQELTGDDAKGKAGRGQASAGTKANNKKAKSSPEDFETGAALEEGGNTVNGFTSVNTTKKTASSKKRKEVDSNGGVPNKRARGPSKKAKPTEEKISTVEDDGVNGHDLVGAIKEEGVEEKQLAADDEDNGI